MPDLRSDSALITVSVTGSGLDKLPWASMEGGDITVTDVKTRPGGGPTEESLGGPPTRSNCTVMREYSNDVLHPLVPVLERLAGNTAMSVAYTPLDGDYNKNGETHTIKGKLIDITTTKRDNNAPEAMFLTLVMSCTSAPAVVS
jgi:hypothetical protein